MLFASAAVNVMQPEPKGHEGGQAGLHVPSAHMRPVHDSAISAGQRPWRKAFVHADRCALCEQNNVPANMHVGSSNLETQPSCSHTRRCAQAPPFLPSAHRRGHRNNCTNTNRRSLGRARRAITSAAIPGRVSHLRAGHQQQCGC